METDVLEFFETYVATISTELMLTSNASQHATAPSFPPTFFRPLTWVTMKTALSVHYVFPMSYSATMDELDHLPRGMGLTGTYNYITRFRELAVICGKSVREAQQVESLWQIFNKRLTDKEAQTLSCSKPSFDGTPYGVEDLILLVEWLALAEHSERAEKRIGATATRPSAPGYSAPGYTAQGYKTPNNTGAGSSLVSRRKVLRARIRVAVMLCVPGWVKKCI